MNTSVPKIFISYSWSSSERVLELARRLAGDGVEVVLDKWDLKDGQDKYAFMERSVVDPSIDKVLIVCDKEYAKKANDRKGGVGNETMVMSPDVYAKATEVKYIPVIFERDEDGEPYTPTYLKSRIYIDLCINNEDYEKEYERLLRNLHEKPENSKPVLGKRPEWLENETVDFSNMRTLLKQLERNDGKNKRKLDYIVRNFTIEFIKTLSAMIPEKGTDFDKRLLVQIDISKPLRDLYFDYIDTLILCDLDIGSALGDFFEDVYNKTISAEGRGSYSDAEFEFSRFLIWEMFIGSIAVLLHYELFRDINELLHRTYFLRHTPLDSSITPLTYTAFRPHLSYLEGHIKPGSETPNLYTLAGEIAIKREKLPIIKQSTLVNADLVLYQLSCVFGFSGEHVYSGWFPLLYVYGGRTGYANQPIWGKLVSTRHCEKLFPLLGATSIQELKALLAKNKFDENVHYPNEFHPAASIVASVQLDKIGTMP